MRPLFLATLEIRRFFDRYPIAGRRMAEFDPFGMQKQSPAGCSVQSVARDRSIESRWMGRMDAQLVRAAGQRVEGDAGAAVPEFQHFVLRDRRFSVQGIDRLSGTVVEVRSQGEFDTSFRRGYPPLQQGDVAFSDGPVFELGLELLVRFFGQGEQQHTRGVHIEAVDYERSRSCGITLPSPVEDRQSFRFSGDGEHPGRFEDGGYPAIFVQKFRGGLRAGAIGFGLDVESPKHVGENRAAFASAGGIVVSVTADFAFRRGSPPEFGDRQRSEPMFESVLQQFGGRTLPCTGRGCPLRSRGEYFRQIANFSEGIEQTELAK